MKAVIPAAGIGKRLRPHTLNKPKALLPVAGRPILGHIVDDLREAGIDGFVIVIGYEGEAVRRWFAATYPELPVEFVEQPQRLGLGHAIRCARPAIGDEPFFCVLGDTILKADYGALVRAPGSVIAVKEVADPRRFGVVLTEGGRVTGFVEKPERPLSRLAIVGAYLFRDGGALWRAMDRVVAEDVRTKGEYQLTDALQFMVEAGHLFGIVSVEDWYDCGKPETWLATNRALLDRYGGVPERPGLHGPAIVAADAELARSEVGPYVCVGPGARIEGCRLVDCVIGAGARLVDCDLHDSLVGERAVVEGARGRIDVGDFCELYLK